MFFELLPTEILVHILKMLRPKDLLTLEAVDKKFFSPFTCNPQVLRRIYFRNFRISKNYLEEFFIPARTAFILELNFDECCCPFLVDCITQCEQLQILRVKNCDLDEFDLHSILQKCKHINELSWTVNDLNNIQNNWNNNNKLTKLCFEIPEDCFCGKNFTNLWNCFLSSCTNLQELEIILHYNISYYNYWFKNCRHESIKNLNLSKFFFSLLHSLSITIGNEDFVWPLRNDFCLIEIAQFLCRSKAPGNKWKKLLIDYNINRYGNIDDIISKSNFDVNINSQKNFDDSGNITKIRVLQLHGKYYVPFLYFNKWPGSNEKFQLVRRA